MAPYWIAQVDAPAALSLVGFVLITIPLFWHLRGEHFFGLVFEESVPIYALSL